ncbi:hypothetical protein [Oceanobacillus kimchii]|uniref:hypothetical protein n=1 Tax=Oceanobacillus kimchii TaxID=746691 RepID=UPI00034D1F0F|nr:hypothetical protein [Oceanobacillus kimchii]
MFLVIIILTIILMLCSIALAVYGIQVEEFSLVVSSLSVLAASISGLIAAIVLKQNKDKDRPYIILKPNYNRYGFIQIEVTNHGTETAIIDYFETDVTFNLHKGQSFFEVIKEIVIPPGVSIKYPLLLIREYEEKNACYTSKGIIRYKNIAGKKYKNKFMFNIENQGPSFAHDNESTKTHYKIQMIPDEIRKLKEELKKTRENKG